MKFFNRFAVSLLASVLCASTLFAMPVDAKKTTKRRQPTQAELAEKIGTNKSYISRVETGKTEPEVSTFYRIASTLGLNVELTPAMWFLLRNRFDFLFSYNND